MTATSTCAEAALVDAHFAGTISPANEARMRAHLGSCEACHRRYRRRQLLAKLDPAALAPEERIARGLGIMGERGDATRPAERVRGLGRWPLIAGGLAIAAAALLYLRAAPPRDNGFTARGGGSGPGATTASGPIVRVFHTSKGGLPTLATGSLRHDDELAFSYENPTRRDRLMIFGLDEHGHVFWYQPAWTDAATDPHALPATTDGARHELREAVAHELDGATLEIHALFLDRDMTAKQLESALAGRRAPTGALDLPGATDHVIRFTVVR